MRYYDECRDPSHQNPLAVKDLAPLPAADQAGLAATGGGTLWGLPSGGDPTVGDKNLSFGLTVPSYGGCGGDYLPIGVQVRLASLDSVDLNQSCATLAQKAFADCFTRISQFRVYNDGNADSQARLTHVKILGGWRCSRRRLLQHHSHRCSELQVRRLRRGRLGHTRQPTKQRPRKLHGQAQTGSTLNLVTWSTPNGTAIYSSSGGALTATPGANPVTISLDWADTNTSHSWAGSPCKNGNKQPLQVFGFRSSAPDLHRNGRRYGSVSLHRRRLVGAQLAKQLRQRTSGPAARERRDGWRVRNAAVPNPDFPDGRDRCSVEDRHVYDAARGQPRHRSSSVRPQCCERPGVHNLPQRLPAMVRRKQVDDAVVDRKSVWLVRLKEIGSPTTTRARASARTLQSITGNASRPIQAARRGRSATGCPSRRRTATTSITTHAERSHATTTVTTTGRMAIRTGGYSKGVTRPTRGWSICSSSRTRRSRKRRALAPPVPILGFASFYVMNWKGNSGNGDDPCPDTTFDADENPATPQVSLPNPPKRAITGVFVETVKYEPGPVDPNATCVEDQLTPCRVTLVR